MSSNEPLWKRRVSDTEDRHRQNIVWFPYPFLLSFGLVILLITHVSFSLNPRLGNPADIITLASKPEGDFSIWLSATPIDADVVLTTGDRQVFRWPQSLRSHEQIREVTDYLKNRIADEVINSAMLKKAHLNQVKVVVAADQRLKYLHIRPLIYAMAEAGITKYAFETLVPPLAELSGEEAIGDTHQR